MIAHLYLFIFKWNFSKDKDFNWINIEFESAEKKMEFAVGN